MVARSASQVNRAVRPRVTVGMPDRDKPELPATDADPGAVIVRGTPAEIAAVSLEAECYRLGPGDDVR